MSASPSGKKRVRFSDAHDVREFEIDDDEHKRSRGPGLGEDDPMSALEAALQVEALRGQVSSSCRIMDPALAAARRASQRRDALMARYEAPATASGVAGPSGGATAPVPGAPGAPGVSFPGAAVPGLSTAVPMVEYESAEALYEDPEELFNEAGVPIEPFHLRSEREEGYFDEGGSYVEYGQDQEEDAWADALQNVEVDAKWAARVLRARRQAGGEEEGEAEEGQEDQEGPPPPPEQLAEYRRRLVELLLPGETVLGALRRLGRSRVPAPPATAAVGAAEAPEGAGRPLGGATGKAPPLRRQLMPPPVREAFDDLTRCATLLLAAGEHDVHSETREALAAGLQPLDGRGGGNPLASATLGAEAGDAGSRLALRLLSGAGPGSAEAAAQRGGDADEAAPTAARAVDADEDIFAADGAGGATTKGGPASEPSSQAAGDESMPDADAAGQAGAAPDPPPAGGSGTPPGAGGAGAAGSELEGFSYDPGSRLWFNPALGCYYDASSQLFSDASSGRWYRYNADGKYELVR